MFSCIIRNEIANFDQKVEGNEDLLGAYYMIRRERELLNRRVDSACTEQFAKSCGIQFSGLDLIDILPPHELESALNGIQSAKTSAATMFAKAEADSRQKILAAKENVEIERLRAESMVQELNTIVTHIEGSLKNNTIEKYLTHRRTELLGDSKFIFLQKEL